MLLRLYTKLEVVRTIFVRIAHSENIGFIAKLHTTGWAVQEVVHE